MKMRAKKWLVSPLAKTLEKRDKKQRQKTRLPKSRVGRRGQCSAVITKVFKLLGRSSDVKISCEQKNLSVTSDGSTDRRMN